MDNRINKNFSYLLFNTPFKENLTKEEALNYLKVINYYNFSYNNICCYDIIDYEKLIFIEVNFSKDEEISEILFNIKKNIAEGYKIKKQYKNRIIDIPENLPVEEQKVLREGYYGIPKELLEK